MEILSPGTAGRDLGVKKRAYERGGVDEYWIVDPEAVTVEVFRHEKGALRPSGRYGLGESLRSGVLPGLQASLDEIFPGS